MEGTKETWTCAKGNFENRFRSSIIDSDILIRNLQGFTVNKII